MRYIVLNPVRANMARHPGDYRWSSYACNAHGKINPLIEPHPLYTALESTPEQRQFAYRELFRAHMEPSHLHLIRDALNQELVLGWDDFKDKIEEMTQRQTRRGKDGRPQIGESSGVYYVY